MIRLCKTSVVTAIAVGLVTASLSHAAVFYVDPETGDMGNDGSAARPWKTVQEVFEGNLIQTRDGRGQLKNADAPVKAGDTILLRSGYHGQIYCRGAYNDDYIAIAAEEGHTPKVRRVFFAAAGKWIIRGLTVCPEFAPEFKRDRLIYVVDWGGPSADFVIEDNTCYSTPDGSSWTAEQWNERVCYGIAVIGERITIRNNLVDSQISLAGASNTADHNIIVKYPNRYFRDIANYDMRHQPGSPAIDAGNADSAPTTDIEGTERPRGTGIDVGPYEF